MPANVQNITGTGAAALTLTGNSLNDVINANTGNDTLIGGSGTNILDGGAGSNVLTNTTGNGLALGVAGNDTLNGGSANNFLVGGLGNDTYTTGSGSNIIAFNKGDGLDVVNATAGSSNTLSLGGNFAYADLTLQKRGNNLILHMGTGNSVTLKNWYAGSSNLVDLQVIAAAMSDYAPGTSSVISNSAVENFNFQALVTAFNQSLVANPKLTTWALTNALLTDHLSSSNSAALGGDLAYSYGTRGSLSGMNVAMAQSELSASHFASVAQTVSPWATLNTGTARIR